MLRSAVGQVGYSRVPGARVEAKKLEHDNEAIDAGCPHLPILVFGGGAGREFQPFGFYFNLRSCRSTRRPGTPPNGRNVTLESNEKNHTGANDLEHT